MAGSPARIAVTGVLGAVVTASTFAAAASLGGLGSQELGAGAALVSSCDGDGVGLTYTTSSGTVTAVTVTGVAASCAGGSLRVVLASSTGGGVGAGGPVTVAGTSVDVTLAPQPSAVSVEAAHVSITGP